MLRHKLLSSIFLESQRQSRGKIAHPTSKIELGEREKENLLVKVLAALLSFQC